MEKTKINQIVVLTKSVGQYCKTVDKGTICKVYVNLDENHVQLTIHNGGDDYGTHRNANINKFRLPVDEVEEVKLTKLFEKSNKYDYATI